MEKVVRPEPPMQVDENHSRSDDLWPLLVGWPHHPFAHVPGVRDESRARYVLSSLEAARQRGAKTYVAQTGGRPQALLQWEHLIWDSDQLGFPVARINGWLRALSSESQAAHEGLLQLAVQRARQQNVRYMLARVPAAEVPSIHILEGNGFRFVDGLLTFGAPAAVSLPRPPAVDNLRCVDYAPEHLGRLRKIAASSFVVDRFHADPVIGQTKADALHVRWLENSCSGAVDRVLVAQAGDEPAGFVTLKIDRQAGKVLGKNIGVIVLVACAEAQRGKGVASLLTRSALDWFRQVGCHWVEVGTQIANIPASRLYESAGFRLVGTSLTFRIVL